MSQGDPLFEESPEDSSFARGLRVLLTVADRGEIRADELAGLLDIPISSVYRYLRTLGSLGFVDHQDGRYRLGARLMITGGSTVSSERLIRLSDPVLERLTQRTSETALLMRRVGLSAACLHQIPSRHRMRVAFEVGEMLPLHSGAGPRVLLAHAPSEILDEVLAQALDPDVGDVPPEPELRSALEKIRTDAVSVADSDPVEGAVTLAAPVFRRDGIVAAVAVSGPVARCGPSWRARATELLSTAAETIRRELEAEER